MYKTTSPTAGRRGGSDGHEVGDDAGPLGLQENQPEDGHGAADCLHVGYLGRLFNRFEFNQIIPVRCKFFHIFFRLLTPFLI